VNDTGWKTGRLKKLSQMSGKRFALIGAAGYIAPRHMQAIKDTGNVLVAALDKHDSVGILDSYFPDCDFFTEFERFDRHIDKLRRQGQGVDYVSICSPNYLHDAHIRFALRSGAHAICEKPLVLNPWNVDALAEIEKETGKKVYTILQLRLHPAIIALREHVLNGPKDKIYDVDLTYITSRGHWYHTSWKGDVAKSGGVATNIGIHFFDMLIWLFGNIKTVVTQKVSSRDACGILLLERAKASWKLSIEESDLPRTIKKGLGRSFRSMSISGENFEFSEGFTNLHTHSYLEILNGRGWGLEDATPSINVCFNIRQTPVS
jgi:UDP-N-acetyl-2-amino-2-deoxyglucuronate dehydrogenase